MSQSPRSSTLKARSARRANRTDAAIIAQYIQDLAADLSVPSEQPS